MNNEPQLNSDTLEMLREVMEDDFPRLIDTFLGDSREHLKRIADALEQQDSDALRRSAHSFKGSSSNIGAQRLSALCQDIEHAAREGRLEGLRQQLALAEQEFSGVASLLQSQLEQS